MCRELNREPAWVGAIKLALTQGSFTVDDVIAEANIRSDRHRTVESVLSAMVDKELLDQPSPDADQFLVGPVLRRTAPSPSQVEHLSEKAVHQWD